MEVLESGQISLEISLFPSTALMSFAELPAGLGIPGGRAPRALGVCSWRCEGQPKPKRLAWLDQPSSSHILHPTPYRKPHTHSALLSVTSRPAWTLQTFPKAEVMAGESFPNFDHWPSHQMAQNVSLLGSSEEKSSQQAHTQLLWGKETTQQQLELSFAAPGMISGGTNTDSKELSWQGRHHQVHRQVAPGVRSALNS